MAARSFQLVPVIDLDTESQLAIREIRNESGVREAMYTDHVIGVNEHLRWIQGLKADETQIVFGIVDTADRQPVGVVSVNRLDKKNRKAEWAFYLAERERGGLGAAIEYALADFAFETLGLEKLNCEVIEGNGSVVKLHKKFHFAEEGFRRANVIKGGQRLGVHLLGLEKEAWVSHRESLRERYSGILGKFEIAIRWSAAEEVRGPIDRIEAARAKNNVNWMNILRIAVEKSPVNARQIIAEIEELDRDISSLTGKIMSDLSKDGGQ